MKASERALTLLELIILIAVIGILAAIAVPAYRDYTVRARVNELVVAAAPYKNKVAEKAQHDRTLASSGVGMTVATAGRISGGQITDNGRIALNGDDASVGATVSIMFAPSISPGGIVSWTCSTGNDSTQWKYVPPDCRK